MTLSLCFYGFLGTDFSTYYLDLYGNIPNSLISNSGDIITYKGYYDYIYIYYYNGIYINTVNLNVSVALVIPKSILYNNNNTIQYFNSQQWIFTSFFATINGVQELFQNVIFNPIFITNNSNQYNLINNYRGYTFPINPKKWYINVNIPVLATLQMIWGQGDIPQEYYSICGFSGTINVQAQNPFTNSNGPYYNTYISTNDNYASNSGWVIVLAGPYDPTLVNPPYLEDV